MPSDPVSAEARVCQCIGLAMIEMADENIGAILPSFPPVDSPLRIENFFRTLYLRYDERFVFGAPELGGVTIRHAWSPASEAFSGISEAAIGFETRRAPE